MQERHEGDVKELKDRVREMESQMKIMKT